MGIFDKDYWERKVWAKDIERVLPAVVSVLLPPSSKPQPPQAQ